MSNTKNNFSYGNNLKDISYENKNNIISQGFSQNFNYNGANQTGRYV